MKGKQIYFAVSANCKQHRKTDANPRDEIYNEKLNLKQEPDKATN